MDVLAHWRDLDEIENALVARKRGNANSEETWRVIFEVVDRVRPSANSSGAVEAIREAYTALCADDLGPNVTVEAVEEARRVLAVVIAQPRGGQSSPAGCPACSRVPGVARPPHTCSGEQS